jgi:hypothetical protein
MPMAGSPYGPAGGKIQSRYSVAGDPRKAIPIYAAGTMDVSSPPHLIGLKGSAYKYGSQIMGGHRNMIHNGGEAHSCYNPASPGTVMSLVLGLNTDGISALQQGGLGTSGAGHVVITSTQFPTLTSYTLDAFGEMIYQATLGASGQFGAIKETFTIAGTVSQVTNGSPTITFAGTTLTTSSLTASYTYTPSKTLIQPGDVLAVTQGATVYYHRIKSVDLNTQLTVYPNWGGTSAGPGAGLGFSVYRTGYGSYSRVVQVFNSANGKFYCYYAGNSRDTTNFGTIECYVLPDNTHFMAPQTTAPLDITADDVILYKGYLLYGAGSTINWSAVGFPNAFPFSATDFPASNITVIDNSDQFVSFEQIGDQVIAMFRNSLWLVYPTGSLPEFNFYRLPEPTGVNQTLGFNIGNLSSTIYLRQRPTTTGRASVFYISKAGLMISQGGPSQHLSETVDAYWGTNNSSTNALSWEPVTDSVIWGAAATNLLYTVPTQSWSFLDVSFRTGNMMGYTAEVKSSNGLLAQSFRRFGPGFWDSTTQTIIFMDATAGGIDIGQPGTTTTLNTFGWNSPLVNLSDHYDDFIFGGFRPEMRLSGSFTWEIWGGSNPYNMMLRQTGVVDGLSTQSARTLFGKKIDDAFVGIRIYGSGSSTGFATAQWAGLVGVNIYDAGTGTSTVAR